MYTITRALKSIEMDEVDVLDEFFFSLVPEYSTVVHIMFIKTYRLPKAAWKSLIKTRGGRRQIQILMNISWLYFIAAWIR